MRHGIDDEGVTLYPAMPYPSYALMSDADIAALYDYFMHGVERSAAPSTPMEFRGLCRSVGRWRSGASCSRPPLMRPPSTHRATRIPSWRAALILVEGAGHCGSCHTPRAITLQEKALDDSSDLFLEGGQQIGGWVAVNLRGNPGDGLGSWSKEDIVATLRTARNAEQAVIGAPMGDVVVHSTQNLTEADLQAIAAYLKTLAPSPRRTVDVRSESGERRGARERARGRSRRRAV